MPKKRQKKGGDIPEWVVTYGDLMSLLLCFFILLAAFSELKQDRDFQDVIKSIQEAFGYEGGIGEIDVDTPPNQSNITEAVEFINRVNREQNTAENRSVAPSGPDPSTRHLTEGLKTVVGTELTFSPGSSDLTRTARDYIVREIIPKLQDVKFKVEIRGHAFGRQDRAAAGDLDRMSYERAKAVKDFMVTQGIASGRLIVSAIGSSEPKTVDVGSSTGMAANRRVQIIMTEILPDQVHPDPNFTNPEAR
ncbi:MAG: flagellar motor protein MotB [Planctomycetota bacterium]